MYPIDYTEDIHKVTKPVVLTFLAMVLMVSMALWYRRTLVPSPFSLAAAAAVSYILKRSIITSKFLEEDVGGGWGDLLETPLPLPGGEAFFEGSGFGGDSSSSSASPVISCRCVCACVCEGGDCGNRGYISTCHLSQWGL